MKIAKQFKLSQKYSGWPNISFNKNVQLPIQSRATFEANKAILVLQNIQIAKKLEDNETSTNGQNIQLPGQTISFTGQIPLTKQDCENNGSAFCYKLDLVQSSCNLISLKSEEATDQLGPANSLTEEATPAIQSPLIWYNSGRAETSAAQMGTSTKLTMTDHPETCINDENKIKQLCPCYTCNKDLL